jgi:SAM-dependent methyltransferase
MLQRRGIRKGKLVDLGCGSGIWARAAARAGFNVVGVDASPAMIRIARRHAPRARFVISSIHSAPLPACDAVTAIGEVFSYGPSRGNAGRRMRRQLGRVARALGGGGVFIFDVLVGRVTRSLLQCRWVFGEGWAVWVRCTGRPGEDHLVRHITAFRRVGGRWRRSAERHVVRLFDEAQLLDALRTAGFSVRTSRRYGDQDLLPGRKAFVARKRSGLNPC